LISNSGRGKIIQKPINLEEVRMNREIDAGSAITPITNPDIGIFSKGFNEKIKFRKHKDGFN